MQKRGRGRPRLKRKPTTELGKTLVQVMDNFGLTQIQLAKAIGVSTRALQRWILDKRKPSPLAVMGIDAALTKFLRKLKKRKTR